MSFSDIRRAVRRARENIKSQRNLLENSEAQTRIVLIDPVLRAVGWDTSNPAMVRSEYGANGGFVDYALLNPETESPLIIVETKSWERSTWSSSSHRLQAILRGKNPVYSMAS